MINKTPVLSVILLLLSSLRWRQLERIMDVNTVPSLVCTAVLACLFLIALFLRLGFRFGRVDTFVALMAGWYLVSTYISRWDHFPQVMGPILAFLTYFAMRATSPLLVTNRGLGIALLGVVLIVLLQLFLLERIFYDLPYPYFGFFETYATLSIFLAMAYPIMLETLKGKNARIILTVTVLAVTVYYSRTAFISLAFSALVYLFITLPARRISLMVSVGLGIIVYFLIMQDTDSIAGRLLIWKILFHEVDPHSLVLGNGPGFVERYYLDLQSGYFSTQRPIQEQLLAGQVHTPFNEYIRILIEQGLVGLSLLGTALYLLYRHLLKSLQQNRAVFISLSTLILSGLFSFPMSSLSICLLGAIVCVLGINKDAGEESWVIRAPLGSNLVFGTVVLFLLYIAGHAYVQDGYLKQWQRLKSGNYVVYNEGYFIAKSEALYPLLKNNAKITHEYAGYLYRMGLHDEALQTALRGKELYSNLDIHLLIASLYEELGDTTLSEKYYLYSINMVPKLLTPRYLLFNMYKETGQATKAKELAKAIQGFPVKVETPEAKQIKAEIDTYLYTNTF